MKKVKVPLKNGIVIEGDYFDKSDYFKLKEIFKDWIDINKKLKPLGGRGLNVPDVFSEALFCIFFNSIRTNGTAYSYDCVSLETHAGIQVKSASIPNDLTSFGPTSIWDEIYYVDFAPNDKVDGKVNFYKINIDFDDLVLNASKGETFRDQQMQGRRPRFSIKNQLIKAYGIKPCLSIDLLEN
jgi:hypothetical protein